jgi:sulfur carrier protein ThiS
VNGELVKREDFHTRTIPPGARVEVIHLVAGG